MINQNLRKMSKTKLFMLTALMTTFFFSYGQLLAQKVQVTVSPQDAAIYKNGERLGTGSVEIKIQKNDCVTLEAFKQGWLREEVKFCNKKGYGKPPKTHYFELSPDDSYSASIEGTDIANTDILIRVQNDKNELELWRSINQIIMNYFDVIEVADRESGYLRTAWHVKSFQQRTVRTRVILKLASTEPTAFKLKIMSEYAYGSGISPKADEKFREWDRVLKSFAEIVNEVQTRIK